MIQVGHHILNTTSSSFIGPICSVLNRNDRSSSPSVQNGLSCQAFSIDSLSPYALSLAALSVGISVMILLLE